MAVLGLRSKLSFKGSIGEHAAHEHFHRTMHVLPLSARWLLCGLSGVAWLCCLASATGRAPIQSPRAPRPLDEREGVSPATRRTLQEMTHFYNRKNGLSKWGLVPWPYSHTLAHPLR